MAKQCPTCQLSQPNNVVFCPKDGARLIDAPLPEAAHQPGMSSTLHGMGAKQQQDLAAALQEADDNASEATQAFDVSLLKAMQSGGGQSAPKPAAPAAPAPAPAAGGPRTVPPIPKPIPRPLTGGHAPVPVAPKPAAPQPAPATPAAEPAKPVAASIRPLPAAVRSSAVAPAVVAAPAAPAAPLTTLAQVLSKSSGLPVNLAVGRVIDVATLLGQGRPTHPLTPAHIAYPNAIGHGKPQWLAATDVPAMTLAQYTAPDAAQGASPATDVYALACILFEALTGKPPFRGQTPEEVAKKHATAASPAVRQIKVDCDLPPGLELELQRGLKKRPGDRHATVQAFSDAIAHAIADDDRNTTALDVSEAALLQQLLGADAGSGGAPQGAQGRRDGPGKPPVAGKPGVQGLVPAAPPAAAKSASPAQNPPSAELPTPPKKTGLVIAMVVGALAVIGGGAMLALRNSEQVVPPPPPAPATPPPPKAPEPDVIVAPDIAPPDVQPDVPDVQPDVPDIQEPDVQPEGGGKNRPTGRKTPDRAPEKVPVVPPPDKKPPDTKPPDKKPPDNRPPVF